MGAVEQQPSSETHVEGGERIRRRRINSGRRGTKVRSSRKRTPGDASGGRTQEIAGQGRFQKRRQHLVKSPRLIVEVFVIYELIVLIVEDKTRVLGRRPRPRRAHRAHRARGRPCTQIMSGESQGIDIAREHEIETRNHIQERRRARRRREKTGDATRGDTGNDGGGRERV